MLRGSFDQISLPFASTALSRSHPSLLLGGPACRSPGVAQAKATPRPHPSLLLGGRACRGMPHPAANRHPKATSMASYGRPSLPFATP